MKISFLPEIENDLVSAYRWYESRSNGLGEDFLRIFYSKVAEITRYPEQYQEIYKQFRRALFRRFPYSIYYMIEDAHIVIYGVFHCSRDPNWLRKTIDKR